MFLFDINELIAVFPKLLVFLPITLYILISSIILGSLFGLWLAKLRLSNHAINNLMSIIYVFIIRCTPSLIVLFIIYYGLPKLVQSLINIDINDLYISIFVIIAFTIIFSASVSEVFRSAYLAIGQGQLEAGLSIGLTKRQTCFRIIFPQALIYALPNYCNSLVMLIKNSSLAYTVGLIDIMGEANLIITRNYGNYGLEVYLAVTIIYLLLIYLIEILFRSIEKKLSHK